MYAGSKTACVSETCTAKHTWLVEHVAIYDVHHIKPQIIELVRDKVYHILPPLRTSTFAWCRLK